MVGRTGNGIPGRSSGSIPIELRITFPKSQPGGDCEPEVEYNTGEGGWQPAPLPLFQEGFRITNPSDNFPGGVRPIPEAPTGPLPTDPRFWTSAQWREYMRRRKFLLQFGSMISGT